MEYILTIECKGSKYTRGVGYALAFSSPHKLSTYSANELRQWRNEVTNLIHRIGDHVFDLDPTNNTISTLITSLKSLNDKYKFKIEDQSSVPAIQIDSVDGHRLELNFNSRSPNFTAKKVPSQIAGAHPVEEDGGGGFSAAENRPFQFTSSVSPLDAKSEIGYQEITSRHQDGFRHARPDLNGRDRQR